MPGQSVFRRLEPLLEQVSKPIQYVGGELNSTVKDWDVAGDATVRWALMYPDAYEVGVPNQGVMILYEVLNERADALAERTYAVWPDLEALMREHARAAVHRRRAPPGRRLRPVRPVVLHRARLHQHAHRARPGRHPAARRRPRRQPPDRGRRRPRRLQPRADRRLHRRRRASATARRPCSRSPTSSAPGSARGVPGGRRELLLRLARTGGVYVPAFYDVELPARRPHPAGRAQPDAPACRGGSPSTPSWTSTRGPTRSSRSCRWPSRCTSGCRSRSSAAAPAAAGSARPA